MTTDAITIQQLSVLAALVGVAFAVASGVVRGLFFILDRFYGKRDAASTRQEQSESCRLEHSGLNSILVQQNAHISKLLEHMGTFLHTAELRHQTLISKMEMDQAAIQERLRNIYYQMPKHNPADS